MAAWDLNDAADAEMQAAWPNGAPSLRVLLERRFAANEPLRSSVGQLAKADLLDPFNTLARTARTARLMLGLCSLSPSAWRTWRLVVAYSAAVLVWIGDNSHDRAQTCRAIRRALAAAGLH